MTESEPRPSVPASPRCASPTGRLRRRPTRRRLVLALAALLAAGLLALLIPQFVYFHHVRQLAHVNPETTAFMELRRAEPDAAQIDYRWVDYADISPALARAVMAAEDGGFMTHNGFDWDSMHEAWRAHRDEGRPLRGASTISQQLAKNLFLSEERTLRRKLQEAIITWMLETSLDKQRILELYLNVIEWGDGVYGAEAAARRFHGISAAELDSWQAAVLAARIPRPRFYHRHGETTFLIRRAARIHDWIAHTRIP